MPYKIATTGASGFIGSQLVPRLIASGCELLLVGRNPGNLDKLFPGIPNCTYEEIPERARDFDLLVHLAVLNNGKIGKIEDFNAVNVDFLSKTVSNSNLAHINYFVNITTFHTIDGTRSRYARSKRDALGILEKERNISVVNVFLPSIYGDDFAGKFSILRRVPQIVRPKVFVLLAALVPTLHIDRLSSFISAGLDGVPRDLMLADSQDHNPVYRSGKRLIDVLFCTAVIGLLGWALFLVWGAVRAGSSGPGIFAQERIGQNGTPFICYKFRTMKKGTEQIGTHEVTSDAVTKIGAFLRRTKIDELPQVWNILRGDMSLVGPRPCLPMQKDLIRNRKQLGVLSVLPGITGLAQINGIDMTDPSKLAQTDARYVARRGLLLELKIIIATFVGRGQGDKVN